MYLWRRLINYKLQRLEASLFRASYSVSCDMWGQPYENIRFSAEIHICGEGIFHSGTSLISRASAIFSHSSAHYLSSYALFPKRHDSKDTN
jgi:hypothetical protein